MSYETIEALHNREFSELGNDVSDPDEFFKVRKSNIAGLADEIRNSGALIVNSTDRKDYDDIRSQDTYSDVSTLRSSICSIIINMYTNEDQNITAAKVINELKANNAITNAMDLHRIKNYADALIQQTMEQISSFNSKMSNSQDNLQTEYLLKSAIDRNIMWDEVELDDVRLIRQITFSDDKASFKCECGNTVTITNFPLFVMTVPVNRDAETNISTAGTLPIKCSCGKCHTFFTSDFTKVFAYFLAKEQAFMKQRIDRMHTASEGCAVTFIQPSLKYVADCLDYIITDTDYTESVEKVAKGSTKSSLKYNDNEMLSASLELLNSLRAKCVRNKDNLDILVRYVCSCIGKDYQEEFNQAIFSIIEAIDENEFLRSELDTSEILRLRSKIEAYEYYLPLMDNVVVTALCNELNSSLGTQYDPNASDIVSVLQADCARYVAKLKGELQEAEQNYVFAMDHFIGDSELFSYIQMSSVSRCSFSDMQKYILDKKSFDIFAIVANGIILNTYSVSFFDYWLSISSLQFNGLNAGNLYRNLFESAYSGKLVESICKGTNKMFTTQGIYNKNVRMFIDDIQCCFNDNNSYSECADIFRAIKTKDSSDFTAAVQKYMRANSDSIQNSVRSEIHAAQSRLVTEDPFAQDNKHYIYRILADCFYSFHNSEDQIRSGYMQALFKLALDKLTTKQLCFVFGISEGYEKSICYDAVNSGTDYDADLYSDVSRLVHGVYVKTNFGNQLDTLRSRVDGLILDTSERFSSQLKSLRVMDTLKRVLQEDTEWMEIDGGKENILKEVYQNCMNSGTLANEISKLCQ